MKQNNHYTFGTGQLAAQRLVLLARTYEEASEAFLLEWRTPPVRHAIDLGCGPGYTTALVQSCVRPGHMTGIDASGKLLAEAAHRLSTSGIAWLQHDITNAPFPCGPADFLFCRFLLTHLDTPAVALRAWATAASPGARLLVQETARLDSDDDVIRRYYDMVERLQSSYGQALRVGDRLEALLGESSWTLRSSRSRIVERPAAVMARLHAMNLRTWSRDPKATALFSVDEIEGVQAELERIADGERAAKPVTTLLREIVASVEASS